MGEMVGRMDGGRVGELARLDVSLGVNPKQAIFYSCFWFPLIGGIGDI